MENVTVFGEKIGIAFQLADDIIDISSESIDSGKTPGTDLREGVPTLVTLRVLASTKESDRDLQKLLTAPIESEKVVAEVLAALRSHSALAESRAQLFAIAEEARNALKPLPICDATSALFSLCDAVVERSH
jgi:heptaprenyl diphosphate synthase